MVSLELRLDQAISCAQALAVDQATRPEPINVPSLDHALYDAEPLTLNRSTSPVHRCQGTLPTSFQGSRNARRHPTQASSARRQ